MVFFNNWENTKGIAPLVISLLTISLLRINVLSLSKHFSQLVPVAVGCQMGMSLISYHLIWLDLPEKPVPWIAAMISSL